MPPSFDEATKSKKGLLRYLRWRDLIVVALGVALGLWVNAQYFKFKEPTDYQKWQARPRLDEQLAARRPGQTGPDPCLFIVPPGAVDQHVISGSVGDCLMLVPDGKTLDIFEVNLWWGDFFHVKTDLSVPDTMSLAFTRTYNASDAWASRIHTYFRHVYDPFLYGSRRPYTYMRWVLPDGVHLYYSRISAGTSFADAVYEEDYPFPVFEGSRIAWNGDGWDLSLANGATYLSPEAYYAKRPQQGSLVGIFDKNGNEVRLKRKSNGDLTEIKSPNGQWIRVSYSRGQISRLTDSLGAEVNYTYDERYRLKTVTDSRGQATEYAYDSLMRVVRVTGPDGVNLIENRYDPHAKAGKAVELKLSTGSIYKLAYHFADGAGSGFVDISDPHGEVTHVTLNNRPGKDEPYYRVEKLASAPTHH